MSQNCCSKAAAGSEVCELPTPTLSRKPLSVTYCPQCGQKGKSVQGQTVKALVSVSLRTVQQAVYHFCGTQSCPVVYYTADGKSTFSTAEIRERVYQKEPDVDDVFVCYCFKHTPEEIRSASPETRKLILNNIHTGIQADQCACDVRNPQGSCCLGNVRDLIKKFEQTTVEP